MGLVSRYVITCFDDDGSRSFLAPDGESGHMYWSDALSQARIYSDINQAKSALGDSDFLKPTKISKAIHPPRLLQMAAGVNYNKPQGTARIALTKVQFEDVEVVHNDVQIEFV